MNNRVILKEYVPIGPISEDIFAIDQQSIPSEAALKDGEVILRLIYLSVDPYLRGRFTGKSGYHVSNFELNQPCESAGISEVVDSKSSKLQKGDYVTGPMKWEEFFVANDASLIKLDVSGISLVDYMGSLGMPSFSAFIGLKTIGQPKPGECVYISTAAGAVGLAACQIAKNLGLRVVGSTGSDEKVKYLQDELGIEAFNYKGDNFAEKLKQFFPNGIDIYYDNVGGQYLEAVLETMNNGGRIICCGMISQYNSNEYYGIKNLHKIITNRLKLQGFIVSDHHNSPIQLEFHKFMKEVLSSGQWKYKIDLHEGIKNIPSTLMTLFRGSSFGKVLLKISEEKL